MVFLFIYIDVVLKRIAQALFAQYLGQNGRTPLNIIWVSIYIDMLTLFVNYLLYFLHILTYLAVNTDILNIIRGESNGNI